MSHTARGVYPVIGYAFMTAVVNVYAGAVFQTLSPVTIAAISFTLAGLVFLTLGTIRLGPGVLDPLRSHPREVLALNVTTAAAWLTVLFSLKYLEPAVVGVISLAVTPVFLALAGTWLRRGHPVVLAEIGASVGIFALIVVLTWGSVTGHSAVGDIGFRSAVVGVALAVVSGLASAGNIVFSKRLSENGYSPSSVMSVRFFLMIVVSWAAVGVTPRPAVVESLGPGLVLAVISVVVPLYLLQISVKHVEPTTVSLLICLGPAFTIGLESLDPRLHVAPLSLLAVLGITVLVAVGVLARHRAEIRARPRRVAVVDAYSTASHLPAALAAQDAECVHVRSPRPDVHLTLTAAGFAADVQHDGDITATAAALRRLRVSQVIAGAESGVLLADHLSAELGTPGNGMSRPAARRNKHDMVLALRDAGLAHAATIVSADVDELIAWARTENGWPVVLKPVASAGTDNVVVCSGPDEVREVHQRIMASADRYGQANTAVLAQEFLAGDEYFVNTVSREGRHHTAEIWRYYKRRLPDGHVIFDYHEPQSPDDPDAVRVERYTHQVLDALQIRNGAGHTEVMLTERGPVLVECGARLGGGQVPEINVRCLGTSQVDLLALAAAKPAEFDRLPRTAYRLLQRPRHVSLINPIDHGVMPADEALAALRALPSYAYMVMAHPPGHPLTRTIDVVTSPGFVYLISDDPDQVLADYHQLRQIEHRLYDRSAPAMRR
ncbi:EamA family transporter [Actinocrispum wychmicini]|uniref:EamA-like transporter family protein n=1 Tax=Actinocrispum wychmicini TaxID=1213861 RepID=A0A4R2JLS5_9PSEU|nr:EamA family transporter [Actinocrispum wychmicini]TCO59552.1 EamA-like transporter family protein [Actinocrispum wychmicini]